MGWGVELRPCAHSGNGWLWCQEAAGSPTGGTMDKVPCPRTHGVLFAEHKSNIKRQIKRKKKSKTIPAQHMGTSWSRYLQRPGKILSASESGLNLLGLNQCVSDLEQSDSDVFLSCHHFGPAVELSYLDIPKRRGIYSFCLVVDRWRSDNTSLVFFLNLDISYHSLPLSFSPLYIMKCSALDCSPLHLPYV